MTSQTMVNKIRMASSQAMIIIKVHMMSSQIMISSMIPIIKTSSPTIHKGKITATTHKVRYTYLFFYFSTYRITYILSNYIYLWIIVPYTKWLLGSVPGQNTYMGYRFDPQLGCVWKATSRCFFITLMFFPPSNQ